MLVPQEVPCRHVALYSPSLLRAELLTTMGMATRCPAVQRTTTPSYSIAVALSVQDLLMIRRKYQDDHGDLGITGGRMKLKNETTVGPASAPLCPLNSPISPNTTNHSLPSSSARITMIAILARTWRSNPPISYRQNTTLVGTKLSEQQNQPENGCDAAAQCITES